MKKRGIILVMIGVIFMMVGVFSLIKSGQLNAFAMIIFFIIGPLVLLYNKQNVGNVILSSLVLVISGFFCMVYSERGYSFALLIEFLIHSVCVISLIMFLAIVKKRTEYGTEMLGKIQGFKNFLETAKNLD